MPRLASHVRTDRISTASIDVSAIRSARSSSIRSPARTSTSPEIGSATSWTETRPTMRSARGSFTSSPSLRAPVTTPRIVPQSRLVMIASCATSTRRRVRYPASAVLSAVSASPFLAPWVDMKYSRIESPSRKFAMMGFSISSPVAPERLFCGFAMSPRIPASWRTCSLEPRAPESTIM